ncbi:MAG: ABC transporter permease [Candidatus Moranbacteria bacterium]|nr:ABC transporter permease [Candidatus Moranbacteria bacterium]
MFKARKMRTALTILGMSVGIGAVLFLVSLGYGLQKALLDRITTDDSLVTLDVTEANATFVPIDQERIERITAFEGVVEVSPSSRLTAQGLINGVSLDLTVIGTTPMFMKLSGTRLEKGSMINDATPRGILISSALATVFEKDGASIIDTPIELTFFVSRATKDDVQDKLEKIESEHSYTVIGVIPSEENIIYVHSVSFPENAVEHYSQLKVKCASSNVMESVREKIVGEGLLVSSLSDTIDQANKIFSIVQIVLMSFGIVALVVSAIGMFNTMTITLMERTEEIGIMKSIGASDMTISTLFLWESIIMGFLGGLGGVVLGIVGGAGLNIAINFLAVRLGGSSVNLFFTPTWFIALIIVFGAFVGFLTALVPARRASKIDPLEALRYK